MDRPAKTPALVQPSIRSFFQPRQQPNYTAPPSSSSTPQRHEAAPPKRQDEGNTSDNANKINTSSPEPQPPSTSIPQAPPIPPAPTAAPTNGLPDLTSIHLPTLPPPPSLPPQAALSPISPTHIPFLRRINTLLLQVPYPDAFYAAVLNPNISGLFSLSILWTDSPSLPPKVVGSIVSRLEPVRHRPSQQQIYIQSLTLLSPYRRLGLAAAALERIISSAAILSLDPATGLDIRSIYAHVWTENEEGLKWYSGRGFAREGGRPVEGYYWRLRPDTAWVVRREIGSMPEKMGQHKDMEAREPPSSVLAGAVNLPGFTDTAVRPEDKQLTTTTTPPPPHRPSPAPSSQSCQKARPETEWNDLPADMVAGNAGGVPAVGAARPAHLSAPASGASSRSSSAARKKKERAYPKAALGT